MNNKCKNILRCLGNSALVKNYIQKILQSPSNWLVVVMTYFIWSLVGMRYSSNQNFDMVIANQHYVMLLSLVSILAALINHTTKLIKLAFIGSISILASFLTVVISKVGIIWLGYPIGYYFLWPITLYLFLLQLKEISCFACCKYYEILQANEIVNAITNDIVISKVSDSYNAEKITNKKQNIKK